MFINQRYLQCLHWRMRRILTPALEKTYNGKVIKANVRRSKEREKVFIVYYLQPSTPSHGESYLGSFVRLFKNHSREYSDEVGVLREKKRWEYLFGIVEEAILKLDNPRLIVGEYLMDQISLHNFIADEFAVFCYARYCREVN